MHNQRKPIKPFALFTLLALVIVPVLGACQSTTGSTTGNADQVNVTVSIVPLAYFAERIGGDWVNTNIMVSPGEEPHSYEPTPEQMVAISESPIFFSIGVEYEDVWLPKFEEANPEMAVVNTSAGIDRIPVATSVAEIGTPTDVEADHHDEEGGLDPHVWLSPENGKTIAENMLNGLIEVAPEHEADFRSNFDALISDIDALDAQIQANARRRPRTSPSWFSTLPGAISPSNTAWSRLPFRLVGRTPAPVNWRTWWISPAPEGSQ